MEMKPLDDGLTVSAQVQPQDLEVLADRGVRSIICNRPDGEGSDQPNFAEIERAATALGMAAYYLPVTSGNVTDEQAAQFGAVLQEAQGPVHAYCRTGMRSTTLWALSRGGSGLSLERILLRAGEAGYNMTGVAPRIAHSGVSPGEMVLAKYDVVIVGGGAAGIACAASLRERDVSLSVAVIDPADVHYYQPGWTFVGAGIFKPAKTARTMASLIPAGVDWIKAAVAAFDPAHQTVVLEGCRMVRYRQLVVAPGLKLNWAGVEGLVDTLGRNGVTSNYRYDLAPYTWKLVSELNGGRALFTQPPMPIKCAGAPQKALYLSADYWRRHQRLDNINVEFYNAGAVLFGVPEYVPALTRYIEHYGAALNFRHELLRVDGEAKTAWFRHTTTEGEVEVVERGFDMIHVVPPQIAPDFVRASPLADEAGWVDVDQYSLQHKRYEDVWSLGDVMNAPNAKTAAAARKQAPVVANNVLHALGRAPGVARYDGYGSCPLTVERGRIVLAEFGYGGELLPSMPRWLVNGTEPSRLAWYLKEWMLPPLYWRAMLRGREWLARPAITEG